MKDVNNKEPMKFDTLIFSFLQFWFAMLGSKKKTLPIKVTIQQFTDGNENTPMKYSKLLPCFTPKTYIECKIFTGKNNNLIFSAR